MTDPNIWVENNPMQNLTFSTITIIWPHDSKFPTIASQWKRLPDRRILATYTRDELAHCIQVFEAIGEPGPGV